jgi:hypothetical protein
LCGAALQQDSDAAAAVMVHELHHALGFTDQLFEKFIDEAGQPVPQDKVRRLAEAAATKALQNMSCVTSNQMAAICAYFRR